MFIYRTKELTTDEIVAIIQDDDNIFITNKKIERIDDLNIEI